MPEQGQDEQRGNQDRARHSQNDHVLHLPAITACGAGSRGYRAPHGGRMPEPLALRSAYQLPLTSAVSSQSVPVAPDGDIGTVCPPIRTVAFTENQTAALPVPAGLAAVIRSDETLNLSLVPRKNPAIQLRCDGTTDRATARAELPDSAVQRARTAARPRLPAPLTAFLTPGAAMAGRNRCSSWNRRLRHSG